jgi:methionyl-tRNA formyltransferase
MEASKIVVFGYDELLLASLDFLSKMRATVSAVIFPSNRQDERANTIRKIVKEKGLTILEQPPANKRGEFIATLSRIAPDLILVWSYPMILPREIIEIPRYGCVNLHLGLLPEYRGVNGVRWALLNGEDKTGVTLHFMDAGIDSGDMISRVAFPIMPEDDILSLMQKSKIAGLRLLENSWTGIVSGKVGAMPQDESKANYYSAKMAPPEVIDWSKSNVQIHNLIRASVAPYPGVRTFWNDSKLVVKRSRLNDSGPAKSPPGTIEGLNASGVEIATGSGNLLITEIEIDGQVTPPSKLSELGLKAGSELRNS